MKLHQAGKQQQQQQQKMEKQPSLTTLPAASKLERKTSIDTEPKTLLEEEMKLAREAALKIIRTHTKEEAMKIFLAGLVPASTSTLPKEDVVLLSDCDEE